MVIMVLLTNIAPIHDAQVRILLFILSPFTFFSFSLKASENPREAFYVGQVVTCVVVSCSTPKQRLALSLNVSMRGFFSF